MPQCSALEPITHFLTGACISRATGLNKRTLYATTTCVLAAEAADTVSLTDEAFEERLAAYLRATEEWAPPDKPQPFERHLLRKKRRSAQFK